MLYFGYLAQAERIPESALCALSENIRADRIPAPPTSAAAISQKGQKTKEFQESVVTTFKEMVVSFCHFNLYQLLQTMIDYLCEARKGNDEATANILEVQISQMAKQLAALGEKMEKM